MRKKLIDVRVFRVEGDDCYLKYTIDYGKYLRRVSDVYNLTSSRLTKDILNDSTDFVFMFDEALEKYRERVNA